MAPEHMGQGSNVTYKSASASRQDARLRLASRIASISAWVVASWLVSRKLWPRPMISPW